VSDERPDMGCTRFEWEQTVRRARVDRVIPAQGKRGAVSGAHFKAVAWAWASWGNPDGTSIFPGIATVAVCAEVSYKTAKLVTAKLVELGLLEQVAPSTRRKSRFDEYRLILHPDLSDRLVVLDPDQMKKAAEAMRESYRGTRPRGGPLDPIREDAEQGPPDPAPDGAEAPSAGSEMGSTGPDGRAGVGSSGPAVWGPVDCGTNHGTEPSFSTKPSTGEDVRTEVAVDSTQQDPIEVSSVGRQGDPPRRVSRFVSPCGNPFCRGGVLHLGKNRKPCSACHPLTQPGGAA
jgi:hypothetical protein